jgi:hypothetical protein
MLMDKIGLSSFFFSILCFSDSNQACILARVLSSMVWMSLYKNGIPGRMNYKILGLDVIENILNNDLINLILKEKCGFSISF